MKNIEVIIPLNCTDRYCTNCPFLTNSLIADYCKLFTVIEGYIRYVHKELNNFKRLSNCIELEKNNEK